MINGKDCLKNFGTLLFCTAAAPSKELGELSWFYICIALRKTGPSSPGPVHYNTGPADNIQKYGTGPVDSVQLDLNCTVRQIVRS